MTDTATAVPTKLEGMKGAFVEKLTRNNKEIRNDRAIAIAEDTQMIYKRKIEDMQLEIRNLERQRENSLDLSPADKMTLKMAVDHNAPGWVEQDIATGVKIRNLKIKLEVARDQYAHLFE